MKLPDSPWVILNIFSIEIPGQLVEVGGRRGDERGGDGLQLRPEDICGKSYQVDIVRLREKIK